MSVNEDPELLEKLNRLNAEDMISWAYETHGQRVGILTSLQKTGCVMIDIARRLAPGMRIITVDTLRLHKETYEFIGEIEAFYGIEIERFKPDAQRVERMVKQHGEFLFFDSKAKQEYCCQIRKVEPNRKALATLDVWFTGLRRDQSDFRKDLGRASYSVSDGRLLLKLSPLADWSEEQINRYLKEHSVPSNSLYEKGYLSIGCKICSTPSVMGEEKRAGRWRWFNQHEEDHKECGIHIDGSGI